MKYKSILDQSDKFEKLVSEAQVQNAVVDLKSSVGNAFRFVLKNIDNMLLSTQDPELKNTLTSVQSKLNSYLQSNKINTSDYYNFVRELVQGPALAKLDNNTKTNSILQPLERSYTWLTRAA